MDRQIESSWELTFYHELGHFVANTIYRKGVRHIKFKAGSPSFVPGEVNSNKWEDDGTLKHIARGINIFAHGCLFQACYLGNKFSCCFEDGSKHNANGHNDWLKSIDIISHKFKANKSRPIYRIEDYLQKVTASWQKNDTVKPFFTLMFKDYLPDVTENSKGDFFIKGEMLKKLSVDCDSLISAYNPKFQEIEDGILHILTDEWKNINSEFGSESKTT